MSVGIAEIGKDISELQADNEQSHRRRYDLNRNLFYEPIRARLFKALTWADSSQQLLKVGRVFQNPTLTEGQFAINLSRKPFAFQEIQEEPVEETGLKCNRCGEPLPMSIQRKIGVYVGSFDKQHLMKAYYAISYNSKGYYSESTDDGTFNLGMEFGFSRLISGLVPFEKITALFSKHLESELAALGKSGYAYNYIMPHLRALHEYHTCSGKSNFDSPVVLNQVVAAETSQVQAPRSEVRRVQLRTPATLSSKPQTGDKGGKKSDYLFQNNSASQRNETGNTDDGQAVNTKIPPLIMIPQDPSYRDRKDTRVIDVPYLSSGSARSKEPSRRLVGYGPGRTSDGNPPPSSYYVEIPLSRYSGGQRDQYIRNLGGGRTSDG